MHLNFWQNLTCTCDVFILQPRKFFFLQFWKTRQLLKGTKIWHSFICKRDFVRNWRLSTPFREQCWLLEIRSCTAIHWISALNKSSGKISRDWRWLYSAISFYAKMLSVCSAVKLKYYFYAGFMSIIILRGFSDKSLGFFWIIYGSVFAFSNSRRVSTFCSKFLP